MIYSQEENGRLSFPRVLVILAAFNGRNFLAEQIDSILNQQGVNVRVVISVDKSTDGTESLVFRLASQDQRISFLPFHQSFGGAASNFFRLIHDVDLAGFDYLSFSDQDDIWHLDKLRRACRLLRQEGADGYSSNVMAFWPSGERQLINKAQPQRRWDFLFEGPGPGCTFVLNMSLAESLQASVRKHRAALAGIDFHDWFAYAFARARGFQWVIDPNPSMLYRQHAANQLGANVGWRSFVHRARRVKDGWLLRQASLTASLIGLGNDAFVRTWSGGHRLGLIKLALQARHCRRLRVHQLLFGLSCLLLALYPPD